MDDTLTFASLHELAIRLRQRELSPVELTKHFLQRIERYNPKLNAYIAVTAERALASARAAETTLASGEIFGDEIERTVEWDGGADLSTMAGKMVRLRVNLKEADLYSIHFV